MSLNIKDIEKLAELARIEILEDEKKMVLKELTSIVGYISEIDKVSSEDIVVKNDHINVFRDDIVTNEGSKYTESILKNAPKSKDGLIMVDQVL